MQSFPRESFRARDASEKKTIFFFFNFKTNRPEAGATQKLQLACESVRVEKLKVR